MPTNLPELIDMALALSRADRQGLLERLRESLEEPDVPGGIIVAPEDLVEEGAQYVYPRTRSLEREVVTLTTKVGPTLEMRLGAVAIADPWDPGAAPSYAVGSVAAKPCPTTVTVITRTRRDTGDLEVQPVAATAGAVDEVTVWHPLTDEGQLHLDSDSGLGAFYEIYDAAALQPFSRTATSCSTSSSRHSRSRTFRSSSTGRRLRRSSGAGGTSIQCGRGTTRTASWWPC